MGVGVRLGECDEPAVPDRPGAARACRRSRAAVPEGPNVQENAGKAAPVSTYEDLLKSAHDDALFEYYFTSQLALVNAGTGAQTPVGKPAIFATAEPVAERRVRARRRGSSGRSRTWCRAPTSRGTSRSGPRAATLVQDDRRPAVERNRADAAACRSARATSRGTRSSRPRWSGSRRSTAATCGTQVPQRDRLVRAAGAVHRPAVGVAEVRVPLPGDRVDRARTSRWSRSSIARRA